MTKTIAATFREMKKQLKYEFPPYHHAHLDVWMSYWGLLENVEKNIHDEKKEQALKKVI
jgi:hypothetical protein